MMDRNYCLPLMASLLLIAILLQTTTCQRVSGPSRMETPCNPDRTFVTLTEEQRLMRFLVGGYDSSVRPVYDASKAVDIRLGLALTQILDLDEKNQVLTVNVWLEAEWNDERLNWTTSDFGGIASIRVPCHKIWLPDIVLYNSVDDYTSGYMPSLAMVYNNSRVFWGPVIRFRSACNIDITYFPFDNQVCRLKMGSWAYNGLQVNVWNKSDTMDLSNFVDNGEWELLSIGVKRNVVYYPCCVEPFPDVTFTIQLRRRTKYYFMNIIIPCIILSFLCLGGFLLPPESGEKITLGLSVLLTITVFMLMVADKMPQTSESISVISIYLMVVLATSCMSVLSSVLVLSIHHKRGRPTRAPAWIRWFCFVLIARIFRLTRRHHAEHGCSSRKPHDDEESIPNVRNNAKWKRKLNQYAGLKKDKTSGLTNSTAMSSADDEESEFLSMNAKENFSNHEIPDHQRGNDCSNQSTTTRLWNNTHNSLKNDVNHDVSKLRTRQSRPHYSSYREMESDTTFTVISGDSEGRKGERLLNHHNNCNVSFAEEDDVNDGSSDNELLAEDTTARNDHSTRQKNVDGSPGLRESQPAAPPCGRHAFKTYGVVIRQLVGLIQTKQNDDMKDEEIFQEWHDVAYVLDRLLFILFFFITLISTVCLLMLRPVPVEI